MWDQQVKEYKDKGTQEQGAQNQGRLDQWSVKYKHQQLQWVSILLSHIYIIPYVFSSIAVLLCDVDDSVTLLASSITFWECNKSF